MINECKYGIKIKYYFGRDMTDLRLVCTFARATNTIVVVNHCFISLLGTKGLLSDIVIQTQ